MAGRWAGKKVCLMVAMLALKMAELMVLMKATMTEHLKAGKMVELRDWQMVDMMACMTVEWRVGWKE